MKKIAFKSVETRETGSKIIEALIALGGVNNQNLRGVCTPGFFYYINSDNIIEYSSNLPKDYIVHDINEYTTNMNDMKKIAFKSAETRENGDKIIGALIALGGVNNLNLGGVCTPGYYYYINSNNHIVYGKELPKGYTVRDVNCRTKDEIEAYMDWQVGDELIGCNLNTLEVIFRSGELVVCKKNNGKATENFTCSELYNNRFRLNIKPIEEDKEQSKLKLTLADIAKLLNANVSQIEIVDESGLRS